MIRAWYTRLFDFLSTAEAHDTHYGGLPEDNE